MQKKKKKNEGGWMGNRDSDHVQLRRRFHATIQCVADWCSTEQSTFVNINRI